MNILVRGGAAQKEPEYSRLITVVRKNWLFCDSQNGAYVTMTMYTFLKWLSSIISTVYIPA